MKSIIYFVLLLITYFIHGCGNDNGEKSLEAAGTIESKEITISSKVVGEIQRIRFDEGNKVSKGDTLVIIDNESFSIQLKLAEANRIISELQLELLRKGARSEDIVQAEDLLKQAETNFRQSETDKNRMQELYDSKSISKKQLEDFIVKYEVTRAQFNSAKENLTKMRSLARPEEIKQAEAKYKQALANEELIRKNIRDSYVVSPIDGYIVKKYIEEGENVSTMSSLLKISDLSVVELMIYVSEEELGKVKLGQKAKISVDAFPDKTFDGAVTFISPEAEFTPKNIQTKDERTKLVFGVKIKVPNPNFELKTGMPADVTIITKLQD